VIGELATSSNEPGRWLIATSLPDVRSWRLGVSVALVAAGLRAGGLGYLLPGIVWYALQFGPLLLLGLAQLVFMFRAGPPRLARTTLAVVWAAVALVVAAAISATGSTEPLQTLSQVGVLVLILLFLLTTYAHRWLNKSVLDNDLRTVFWVGVGLQGIGVIGFLTNQTWAVGEFGRMVGTTTNANFVGIGSAVLVALSFNFTEIWTKVGTLVPLAALFLSDSRGSLLGLSVGLVAMLTTVPSVRRSKNDRRWAGAILVAMPILFLLRSANLVAGLTARFGPGSLGSAPGTPAGPGSLGSPIPMPDLTSGRLEIYRAFLSRWTEQPWLGGGYRTTQVRVFGQIFEAHNIYISVLVEMGVVGAVAFLALLVCMFRSAARHVALIGAAATVLVADLTASTLFGFGNATAIMGWLALFGWAATGLNGVRPDRNPVEPVSQD
jgi:O-antigen ligase